MVAKWRLTRTVLVGARGARPAAARANTGAGRADGRARGTRNLALGCQPGAIQDQDDLLGGTGADRFGEGREFDFEERGMLDRGGEVKDGLARSGLHKADQVAPMVARPREGR